MKDKTRKEKDNSKKLFLLFIFTFLVISVAIMGGLAIHLNLKKDKKPVGQKDIFLIGDHAEVSTDGESDATTGRSNNQSSSKKEIVSTVAREISTGNIAAEKSLEAMKQIEEVSKKIVAQSEAESSRREAFEESVKQNESATSTVDSEQLAREEESRRLAAEAEASRLAAEEASLRAAAEAEASRLAAEEASRKAAEEESRRIALIEQSIAAEQERLAEESRRAAEEEASRKAAEEAATRYIDYTHVYVADQAYEVLAIVNQVREAEGLQPLSLNLTLTYAANKRAREIEGTFSHTRPDGSDFSTVYWEYFYVQYRALGENIAKGPTSAEMVMLHEKYGWMNSQGHRANILSDKYTQIGIGYYDEGGTPCWVQLFVDFLQ